VTRHWAAGNEVDESLRRQWTGIPFAVVTRLELLRSINPEQTDALTTKFHGIAVRDCETMRRSSAVDVGLRGVRSLTMVAVPLRNTS